MKDHCRTCGMLLDDPIEFHPHLFCMLRKAGIMDPRHYLTMAGWSYTPKQSVIPKSARYVPVSDETAPSA